MKLEKIISILCVAIMFAIGIGTLAASNKQEIFSEDENRMLNGMPELSWKNIISGDFAADYENYMIDRIPLRNLLISIQNSISSSLSIVTLEDTMNVLDTKSTQQMEGLDEEEEFPDLPELSTPTPESTPSSGDRTPTTSVTSIAIAATPTPNPNQFADSKYRIIGFTETDSDKSTTLVRFETKDVISYANTLNLLASMLPADGHLVHAISLESKKIRPLIANVGKGTNVEVVDETTEVLEYYTNDNIIILSASTILEEPIKREEYIYFFTDTHWTVEGAHYVYTEALNQIGIKPLLWDEYDVTYEYPYRGAYHRNEPSTIYTNNPDTLAIVKFPQASTFTHYLGENNITERPVMFFDAPANDRYRVHFGGPTQVGPLGVAKTTSQTNRNALVIIDSYGLPFTNMLIPHYDTICIVDLRYMYKSTTKYYISDLVKEYDVDDIYIVTGDQNAYGTYYQKSIALYAQSN